MNKTILFGVGILIIGLVIGYFGRNVISRASTSAYVPSFSCTTEGLRGIDILPVEVNGQSYFVHPVYATPLSFTYVLQKNRGGVGDDEPWVWFYCATKTKTDSYGQMGMCVTGQTNSMCDWVKGYGGI